MVNNNFQIVDLKPKKVFENLQKNKRYMQRWTYSRVT